MKRTKEPARTPNNSPSAHAQLNKDQRFSELTAAGKTTADDPAKQPRPSGRQDLKRSELPSILFEGDEVKPSEPARAAQKFSTGSDVVPAAAQPETLPESYGTGKLMLTARDPRCLYAHWDVTPQQLERYGGRSTGAPLTLRVHQESLSGPLLSEIRVEPGVHYSFVAVDAPAAKRFVADLGYSPAEGGWKTVATGETLAINVSAPPVEDIRFATLPFAMKPTEPSPSPVSVRVPSTEASRSGQSLIAAGFPLPNRLSARPAERLAEEPFAEASSQSATTSRAPVFGPEWVGDAEGMLQDWEGDAELPIIASSGSEIRWTTAQEKALAEVIGWSSMRTESYSSLEVSELLQGIRQGEVSGKPIGDVVSVEKPELSSAGLAGAAVPQEHGFWFNVNAELVIYGATEPNAAVTVAGQPVALRSDGTFSCRFALPDGEYPLVLAANSIRGEVRQAELRFSRNTLYSEGTGVHPQSSDLKSPGEDL